LVLEDKDSRTTLPNSDIKRSNRSFLVPSLTCSKHFIKIHPYQTAKAKHDFLVSGKKNIETIRKTVDLMISWYVSKDRIIQYFPASYNLKI